MYNDLRWNTQFFSQSHNNTSAYRPKSHTYFQPVLFTLGCLLLLALACIPSFAQTIAVSDQKPGSLLVFPYYNTIGTNNARIAISNTSDSVQVFVHLFFLEGATCNPSDSFICLTPNGGITMFASDMDPLNVGYIIAVAVNALGEPIAQNSLIGNAFVNATIGTNLYIGNYSAESFAAVGVPYNAGAGTATLVFNGSALDGYDQVPNQFSVQIQNAGEAPGQMIVTAGLTGDMTIADPNNANNSAVTGAGQVGVGRVIGQNEIPFSFSRFLAPGCLATAVITATSPRLSNPLLNIIPNMETGQMKFGVGAAVGLIMTPQSTLLAAQRTYIGIRTLHKMAVITATLTIPTFAPPSCATLMGNQ